VWSGSVKRVAQRSVKARSLSGWRMTSWRRSTGGDRRSSPVKFQFFLQMLFGNEEASQVSPDDPPTGASWSTTKANGTNLRARCGDYRDFEPHLRIG
jgi:hypothetical protein